ncbi:phenylacetate--CoA ligase family protein [Desulfotalea psychrophila]|uniref:Phenylacetate-coenzyme A ligase n=1 Tax=Desulfotalea psychrophila (strain LSv54 / DSM 12343) TaxID=177439 RepID=Q6ANS9_DESPS|nr:phenylacetate--CoA ligase [Desulfotalea psychrophila]CAG35995.1 probable coenzyme F390 synthetase II [Desulfotalea psychrophila LSv54]
MDIVQGDMMSVKYWDEEIETLPREGLESIQLSRLKKLVARMYKTVVPYREKMEAAGVTPSDIKSLADLAKLPFTVKDDLRDNYPFGLFAVPMDEVVRVHASSGTTGKPTVVGYTQDDIVLWSNVMARALTCAGASKKDMIHNSYGYGLFTGGLGAHYGIERLGATVIPVSGGNTKRQITVMKDFGATVLLATPSYALNLAETMDAMGVDPATMPLRIGVFGAEPWSENMREEVEAKLNIKAVDIYGLSEVMGPGVAMECLQSERGMHISEDHFLPEIIDPVTGEVLPPGSEGELVFTTLTKEAFPIIRYRTRDISRLYYEKCACGRTLVRMEKVLGRTDDMLIIRGVNVFPSQVEHVLMSVDGVEPHYQIVVDRIGNLDTMSVQVEVSEDIFSDEIRKLEKLTQFIQREIKDLLGVSCKVQLVESKTIQRSEGKAKRVIDNRKI